MAGPDYFLSIAWRDGSEMDDDVYLNGDLVSVSSLERDLLGWC